MGGAIHNAGYGFNIINESIFKNNKAIGGGAIDNDGRMSIFSSTFSNNKARVNGGAISNYDYYGNKDVILSIISSTFTDNKAKEVGDAIENWGYLRVSNNTMTTNTGKISNVIYNGGNMGILNLTYLSNSTKKVRGNTLVTLYASLTDDMGNPVTGGKISFYVNGKLIKKVKSVEGFASTSYFVTQGIGSVLTVTGDYNGRKGFDIITNNAQLLVDSVKPINPINNNNFSNGNSNSDNNPTKNALTGATTMKSTGMPIVAILLVLLASTGILGYRKRE